MKNFLKNFSFMGFLMLMLCVLLGVGDMSGAICANGTATDLNPDGTGTQLTGGELLAGKDSTGGDVHENEHVLETSDVRKVDGLVHDPVDQQLVKIRPYANQLDTILRYGTSVNTSNLEFGWYSMGTRDVEDELAEAATLTSNATVENVKGSMKVNRLDLFDETDTVFVPNVDGADGNPLVLYVYEKTDDSLKFTIAKEQMNLSGSTYSIPAIGSGEKIYALGRAAAELDVETPGISFLPEKSVGYCQIFKVQIAQSTYEKMMSGKEIKFDLGEIEEQALFEFRRRMEGSFLLGSGTKVYDPRKKTYIYRTKGIINQITKHFDLHYDAVDGNAEIVNLHKFVFVGNSGAKVRFALCGSDALANISKMQGIYRKQEAVQTEVVFGITWSKMVSNFGTINCSHSEILDTYGMSDKMVIFDPQFIKKWSVNNLERQVVDGKAIAKLNGDITIFTEVAGAAVYNPDAHCIVTVKATPES